MAKNQTLAEPKSGSATTLSKGYIMSAALTSLRRRVARYGISSPQVLQGCLVWGELYEEAD